MALQQEGFDLAHRVEDDAELSARVGGGGRSAVGEDHRDGQQEHGGGAEHTEDGFHICTKASRRALRYSNRVTVRGFEGPSDR